jgi:hypothetical protein
MAIALEVHRASSNENVHDQAATERELMLRAGRVFLYHIRMFLPDDADEKVWVVTFDRHLNYSLSKWDANQREP